MTPLLQQKHYAEYPSAQTSHCLANILAGANAGRLACAYSTEVAA